jgi:hypothetical protein
MASISTPRLFRFLPAHAAAGAGLGLGLLWGLTMIDEGPLTSLILSHENGCQSLVVLSVVFASYFAVGSALTGFLLLATDQTTV